MLLSISSIIFEGKNKKLEKKSEEVILKKKIQAWQNVRKLTLYCPIIEITNQKTYNIWYSYRLLVRKYEQIDHPVDVSK